MVIGYGIVIPRSCIAGWNELPLEVGCGHGRTLARLARASAGFVAGSDASDVMVRLARRRLRREIGAGEAEISLATSGALPYPDARFDAALAVHVLYFWKDAVADLRECQVATDLDICI